MKKYIVFLVALLMFGDVLYSQVLDNPETPMNRAWEKKNNPSRKLIPYVYLREQDVMFAKRVWREIDLREKVNHKLYYPTTPVRDRISLAQVMWDAVSQGEIIAYDDEDFTKPKTPAEVQAENTSIDTVQGVSPLTGNDTIFITTETFKAEDVIKYRITEDWFFDKQRSMLDVRILSIAPLVKKYTTDPQTGERIEKGYEDIFYIHFPSARPILARTECFNTFNDGARLTYDDIFWKRTFGSYIFKEENVYDRIIGDYVKGLDALMEAENIKDKIRNFEHDLWEF